MLIFGVEGKTKKEAVRETGGDWEDSVAEVLSRKCWEALSV